MFFVLFCGGGWGVGGIYMNHVRVYSENRGRGIEVYRTGSAGYRGYIMYMQGENRVSTGNYIYIYIYLYMGCTYGNGNDDGDYYKSTCTFCTLIQLMTL